MAYLLDIVLALVLLALVRDDSDIDWVGQVGMQDRLVKGRAPSDVAFNKFVYDVHGNLVTEYQSHGAPVNVNTSPRIDYSWDYQTAHSGGDNHNRLDSMTYPARTSNSLRRVVELGYATGADDLLSRIATITSKHDGTTAKQLSEYSYFGTSRVASTRFGFDGTAPVMTLGVTAPMLDRFGMPRDLFYDAVQANQDLRFVASRDAMGSPTSVETTLRGASNTRSWTFAYDALNRLDIAASGQLSSGSISSPSMHGYDWAFDSRDNWAGDGTDPGLEITANGSLIEEITHTVEKDSSIASVTSSATGTVNYVYDDAGSLTNDGTYTYQYDAWNRLVKVTNNSTSAFVLHYTYDGLGRLVRRQGPYPGYANEKRVEHYYYDGSRRIQEVMTDPVTSSEEEVESEEEPTYSYNIWTTREYVWSPHGTDVLLAQFEHLTSVGDFAQPWFGVHDHSGDLVGVVDADGTVREQRSYSPYGELLYTEAFAMKSGGSAPAASPVVKLGHDGLFFDRFNASILAPPHAVGARGVYYNVNRTYSPHLGRFLQSDPNATGALLSGVARNPSVTTADPETLYGQHMSLYAAYGSNPACIYDPLGLYDMEDFAEDVLSSNFGLPGPGDLILGALQCLVDGYAANQTWDLDWAGDFEFEDDLYSRLDNSWIGSALLAGVHGAFDIGIGDFSINLLDEFVLVGRSARVPSAGKPRRFGAYTGKRSQVLNYSSKSIGHTKIVFYQHPRFRQKFVHFSGNARLETVRIRPTGSRTGDKAAANNAMGRPAGFDWSKPVSEGGKGFRCVWHHDLAKGRMILVPEDVHLASLPHDGGFLLWR